MSRVGTLIAIRFGFFLAHAQFGQVVFIPLLGQSAIAIIFAIKAVIVVVPGTPEPGIVVAPAPAPPPTQIGVSPARSETTAAQSADTVAKRVAELIAKAGMAAEGAETIAELVAEATRSAGSVEAARCATPVRNSERPCRGSGTGVHSTREASAAHAAGPSEAAMKSTASVTATLSPER